ncbi:MAG: hypothetical protein HOD68_05040 [Flavobacteriales bacterium]|nr:hypothetical protein [Flavobacteriales bacterium]
MKNILSIVSVVLLFSCQGQNKDIIRNVDAIRFNQLIYQKEEGIIIDVRTSEEFQSGHLKDATNIDYYSDDFSNKINLVQRDVPIYLYCRSGGRSSSTAKKMLKLGFKEVYNLNDGISSWISEELSIVKSESELLNKKTNHAVTKLDIENFLINNQFSLLYISTQWCVPCKKLKPIIDDLQSDFKDVNILNIDADINKSEIIDFNVTSVPVIILFKNNIEIFRNIGFISKESLYNQLVIINR